MPDPIPYITNPETGKTEPDYTRLLGDDKETSFYWTMTYPRDRSGEIEGHNVGYGPAPMLRPINKSNVTLDGDVQAPSTLINIRDSHHWTESPRSSRGEVPMLNLKELKILNNVGINTTLNMIVAAGQSLAAVPENLNDMKDQVFGAISAGKTDGDEFSWKAMATQLRDSVINNSSMSSMGKGANVKYNDPLAPYMGMYSVMSTGFKYVLPYMEDSFINNNNAFGDSLSSVQNDGLLKLAYGAAKFAKGLGDALNLNKLVAPGRLIENPKAFTFEGREKSYTVTFPLLNTKSYNEVVRNWQFLYLLAYQNTPNRVNRDLIDPPCIYEAYIPGVWYSKYSAITNMSVEYVGARREMYLPIQVLDSPVEGADPSSLSSEVWKLHKKKTVAVIPDAYMVTITLTELFSETQNFKYHMLRESMNDIISTGVLND